MNKIITILLGIFGFASISLFLMWGALHLIGKPETAKKVKNLPNTVEGIKEDVTQETVNVLSGAVVDLNEEREKAVANEEDQNLTKKFPSLGIRPTCYSICTRDIIDPFGMAGLTGQTNYEWELNKTASEEGITLPGQIVKALFEPTIKQRVETLFREYWGLRRQESPEYIRRVLDRKRETYW